MGKSKQIKSREACRSVTTPGYAVLHTILWYRGTYRHTPHIVHVPRTPQSNSSWLTVLQSAVHDSLHCTLQYICVWLIDCHSLDRTLEIHGARYMLPPMPVVTSFIQIWIPYQHCVWHYIRFAHVGFFQASTSPLLLLILIQQYYNQNWSEWYYYCYFFIISILNGISFLTVHTELIL